MIVRLGVLLLAGLLLTGVGMAVPSVAQPGVPGNRAVAEARWEAAQIDSYRLVALVEWRVERCLQELEVRSGVVVSQRNGCGPSWLGQLTVDRLFELSRRLELPPECFPAASNCPCERRRVGTISYDEQLGLPTMLSWRREVAANWGHPDFWRELGAGQLPSCGPSTTRVRIEVLTFE